MKEYETIYLRCRKVAANYNEKLNSREGASELLGISVSSLANYELGITKVIPPDVIIRMADLYNAPELKSNYCKHECPIGRDQPIGTCEGSSIELATVRLMRVLNPDYVNELKNNLLEIAEDGIISENEVPLLKELTNYLDNLTCVVGELRQVSEKCIKGEASSEYRNHL